MIYQLSRDLEVRLKAQDYPVNVVYQEGERLDRATGSSYEILIGRDPAVGDQYGTVVASASNPRKLAVRKLGVSAYFYVQARRKNALLSEHQHDCDALVDAFLVALEEWIVSAKAGTALDITEARYLTSEEFNGCEHFHGVVYLVSFRIPRALRKVKYEGGARETAIVQAVGNTFFARVEGGTREEVNGDTT